MPDLAGAEDTSMAKTFLRLPDVIKATGLRSSTIYEMIAADHADGAKVDHPFPKPIKIGRQAVAWLDEEIELWQENKIAAHRNAIKTGAIDGK